MSDLFADEELIGNEIQTVEGVSEIRKGEGCAVCGSPPKGVFHSVFSTTISMALCSRCCADGCEPWEVVVGALALIGPSMYHALPAQDLACMDEAIVATVEFYRTTDKALWRAVEVIEGMVLDSIIAESKGAGV